MPPAMGQTSYPTELPVGYAGMQSDNSQNTIDTGFGDEVLPIPFGLGMVKGTSDKHYRLPNASGDKIDGISVFSHSVNIIGSTAWANTPGPGPTTAWATSTAWTVGQLLTANGRIYRCTTAGTSDGSTAPSAVTTAADSITDGTAKLQYVQTIASGYSKYEPGIPAGDVFGLLTKGRVYVIPEADVVQDGAVYCRFALGSVAGVSDQLGAFATAVDTVVVWVLSTAYVIGQRVVNDTGKLYQCITAGTSASSGGPTGTAADITDGSCHWKYLQAQAAGASNTVVKGARWVTSGKAGTPVAVQFDKLLALS